MQEVYERVWVADDQFCRNGEGEWAVVHACKVPCHQRAVGYRGSLPSTHPNYLALSNSQNLFLNIIDPPKPLFMPASFDVFLSFADREWLVGRKLLIHCNQGESRAPSLALLFLAKRRSALSNSSYSAARLEFERLYPAYNPSLGIQAYLTGNWHELGTTP
ncbi:MAG: hypothetical protein ACYCUI_09570 [Vulcanimicrobiaceae bacterium]